MARTEASLMLYAVDLDEFREWVGCGDEKRFREALQTIGGDEEAGWAGDLQPTFERLLRRVMLEGELYPGLGPEDRYYLTQLLIDLFDEYVDAEPLSDELPLDRLLELPGALPKGSTAATPLARLLRGRELGGDALLWEAGPFEEAQPYLGYVTRAECAALAEGLEQAMRRQAAGGARPPKGRPSGLMKQLAAAARECAETEFDLVAFVG